MAVRSLYIVSSPHGGSTLASIVLGNHPAAFNLGEVSFIPKLLALREPCTCGEPLVDCAHWGGVFDQLEQSTGKDLRQDPYSLFLGEALKGKDGSGLIDYEHQTRWRYLIGKSRGAIETAGLLLTPRFIGLNTTTLPSVRKSVANTLALYRAAAQVCDAQLVIDASKQPRKAPQLYSGDPDNVRILHLVRDGRGVVTSRRKYMPIERSAERWNHYHRLSTRILDRWVPEEHRRRVRYEDFVADPPAVLRELFEWLGLTYTDACLQFSDDQVVHSAGGNPARFGLSDGIRSADERWRTELSPKDLAVFDRLAGPLNRELGYE